ncbi:hypothetical protein A2U01_0025799, partial [Trifolium medium]|nr:hypothetical protein [Trifolium medium]
MMSEKARYKAIESDLDLFLAVEEALRGLEQWLCGKCVSICALSRACHHPDGLIQVTLTTGEVKSHIALKEALFKVVDAPGFV